MAARFGRPGRACRRGVAVLIASSLITSMLVLATVATAAPAGATGGCTSTPSDDYGAAVCADSPVGYWRLRDGSGAATYGDTVADAASAGNGTLRHNGQSSGGDVTRGVAGPMASIDSGSKAYEWPGSGTRCWGVDLPSTAKSTVLSGTFTVEMWAKYRSDVTDYEQMLFGIPQGTGASSDGLAGHRDSVGHGGYLRVKNGLTGGSVPVDWIGGPNASPNWHQVAATRVGGAWIVYVDGVPRGVYPSTMLLNADLDLWIGRPAAVEWAETTCTFPFQWGGDIAEVALYPSAVDPVEIAKHYVASGRSLPGGLSPEELYGGTNPALKCVQCFVSGTVRNFV